MGPGALILLGIAKVAAVMTAAKVNKHGKRADKQEKEPERRKNSPDKILEVF